MRALILLPILLSLGCSDPFDEAQKEGSIEAYETFLADNPNSPFRLQGEIALEELYLEKARTDGTLEAYDTYIEKFPKGQHIDKARDERREFLFSWADKQDTSEGWETFLEEYEEVIGL